MMLDKGHVPFMIDNPVSSSEGGIGHPVVSVAPQMSILSILQSFIAKIISLAIWMQICTIFF